MEEPIPHRYTYIPGENTLSNKIEEILNHNKNTSTIIDEKTRDILSKDRNLRTDEDLDHCYNSLIKVPFIEITNKKYGSDLVKSIFKCLNYTEVDEGTTILKFGDIGYSCFILFEGSCEVLIPGVIKSDSGHIFDNVRVGVINQGTLFGDKSLIDKKQRTASIKTLTTCLLGELKKKDFLTIFENSKKIEVNEVINFYKAMKLFSGCNRAKIEKFTYCMETREYKGGDLIVNQDGPINNVYIVRKGLFNILYKTEKTIETIFGLNYFSEANSNDPSRFTVNRAHEIKGYKKTAETHKLFVLGVGEFFGDIELVHKNKNSHFSLICSQTGSELLQCSQEKFRFYIGRGLFEILEEMVKEKIENYRQRFKLLKNQIKLSHTNVENKLHGDVIHRVLSGSITKKSKEQKNFEIQTNILNKENKKNRINKNSPKAAKMSLIKNMHVVKKEDKKESTIDGEEFPIIKEEQSDKKRNFSSRLSLLSGKLRPNSSYKNLNKSLISHRFNNHMNIKMKLNKNYFLKSNNQSTITCSTRRSITNKTERLKSASIENQHIEASENLLTNNRKKKPSALFILTNDTHLINRNNNESVSKIPILNFNVHRPFYDKNNKTIFSESSKSNILQCAEINKNYYLDNENIKKVLKSKYDVMKKNSFRINKINEN